jgi:hypothetical protein
MKLYNLRVVSPLSLKKSAVVDELKKKGKSKNKPDSAYDAEQLKMGIKVEMEHGLGADAAKEIAKDHLEEIADYYSRLDKMESSAKKSLPDLEKSDKEVEAATKHENKLGAGAKKRKKLRGQDKVHAVMKEFEAGTLHSGSGEIVTDRKQAIAIAMSEAGLSKKSKKSVEDYLDALSKAKGGAAKTMRDKDYAKVKGGKKKNFKSAANSRENAKFAKEQRKAAGYEKSGKVGLVLTKGRKMAVGTIATWQGKRYQKVSEGMWKPVPKGKTGGGGEEKARVAIRSSEYRGKKGFDIVGKDTTGRKVRIFTEDRGKAEGIVAAIKENKGSQAIDDILLGKKGTQAAYLEGAAEGGSFLARKFKEAEKTEAKPAQRSAGIPAHSTEEATVAGVTAQIKKFAKLPLTKLREYQGIQDQQMQMVYENKTMSEDRKAQLTDLLQMRRNIYTAAVNVKSFRDKAENWADNIVEEGKQSKTKWEEFKAKRASEQKKD